VFNLPDAFTVNSSDARIQNNTWIGAQQQQVAEPSTLALFAFGITGAALLPLPRPI
jgi:hypothetical protein